MAEITVQFSNQLNGYKKSEVNQFVKDAEAKLQEKASALANMQQQVVDLEARLNKITGADSSVEEKLELYDKLMKKMDGDYTNLLTPAIAKAKAIEKQAQQEYNIRMDQARYAADGIYKEAADRIADVVDDNMDRIYDLIDEFLYSKTLPGRIKALVGNCKSLSAKIAEGVDAVKQAPKKACNKVKATCANVKATCANVKEKVQEKIDTYKAKTAAPEVEETVEAVELAE